MWMRRARGREWLLTLVVTLFVTAYCSTPAQYLNIFMWPILSVISPERSLDFFCRSFTIVLIA